MRLLVILFSLFTVISCGKKSADKTNDQMNNQISVNKPVSLPEKVQEPLYAYEGTQFNDPFIQLDGDGFGKKPQQEEGKLDPATLILKGILIDKNEKMASLTDSSGNFYLVKNKRLYTRKGEIVEGVVGIVKLESVVIITQDKTVREIKLKTDEEY